MRSVLVLCLFLTSTGALSASPASRVLPDAQQRGSATFRYLGIPVYDGRLFTTGGGPLDWTQDFALELTYRRDLRQTAMVDSTLEEFARLGAPLPLRKQLGNCFFDVQKGDRYLAVTQGQDRIAFWRNGRQVCTLGYRGIKRRFMEIFLGDNTRSPGFTRRLRGD